MAKKNLKAVLKEFHELKGKESETRQALYDKKAEAEAKLSDLQRQLSEHQQSSTLDLSNEAFTAEIQLKQEIASTDMLLGGIQERIGRIVFLGEVSALSREAVELAKVEALDNYNKELPALLEKIGEAKYQYLNLLAEYHLLHNGVRKQVIETAKEVGHSTDNISFPYPRVVAFGRTDHAEAEGVKYGMSEYEVLQAIERGKVGLY